MLKRPMCLISLAFILVIYLVLHIKPPPDFEAAALDRHDIHISGQVYQKECKSNQQIIYLKQVILQNDNQAANQVVNQVSNQAVTQPYRAIIYLKDERNTSEVKMGSDISVYGKLRLFSPAENEGQFDALNYYKTLGIDFSVQSARITAAGEDYNAWREWLHQLRERMKEVYRTFLPEKEAGILQALILGDKSDLSADIKELYMQAGISHILSLSGVKTQMLVVM